LVDARVNDQFVRLGWRILHQWRRLLSVRNDTITDAPTGAAPASLPKLVIKKKLLPTLGYGETGECCCHVVGLQRHGSGRRLDLALPAQEHIVQRDMHQRTIDFDPQQMKCLRGKGFRKHKIVAIRRMRACDQDAACAGDKRHAEQICIPKFDAHAKRRTVFLRRSFGSTQADLAGKVRHSERHTRLGRVSNIALLRLTCASPPDTGDGLPG
jgi:hypothetical protein